MTLKVAVVGAGLMGRVLAWRLSEAGAQITLIDANSRDHKGTGLVAAAMIAPFTEAVTTEPLVEKIGVRSLALWPEYLAQLEATTHQPVYYSDAGTMVVAHPPDQADWQRFMQHASIKLSPNKFTCLDQQAIQQQAPELAQRFDQAAFFDSEAVLDNQQLYAAFEQYFDQKSVNWLENTALDNLGEASNGQLKGFDQPFDWVFDCRGNGALEDKPLRAVRGEVLRVCAPDVDIKHAVRLMHPRYPLYLAPKQNNRYVIGATQIESKHLSPVTVRSGLELLSALYSLHSGFAEAQIESMDVACRPAYPDNLPRIGQHGKRIQINGLYRHGYLFAPALAEATLAMMNGQAALFPEIMTIKK